MPVTFDQTVQFAQLQPDTARVYLHDTQDSVDGRSGVGGLARLFGAEKAANRDTINAFLRTVTEAYPQAGRDTLDAVRAMLNERLRTSQPLTAGDIKTVRAFMDIGKAGAAARQLETGGQLPPGHASAFAQFVGMRGLPLDTPDQRGAALKQYLLLEVVPGNSQSLGLISGHGDKDAALTRLCARLGAPLDGPTGFYARQIDNLLQNGINAFSFEAFTQCMTTGNTELIELAAQLPANLIGLLADLPGELSRPLLDTLKLALPQLQPQEYGALLAFLEKNGLPLGTPTEQAAAVRAFLMDVLPEVSCTPLMGANHLPDNLAGAIGRHPEVLRAVTRQLEQTPGLPTREQVSAALRDAVAAFCTKHEAPLRELVVMSQNPPVVLTPPLSAATLPLYLNTLLTGDTVLEPLLNEGAPITADFMDRLSDYSTALNTGGKFVRGDFGADDAAQLIKNTIQLLLARRGVDVARYPDVMSRVVSRFGPLASGVASLVGRVGSTAFQREILTTLRVLEGHGRALLEMMPREMRAAFGASLPMEPATPDDVRKEKQLGGSFIEDVFEKELSGSELPAAVREMALRHGVQLPGASDPTALDADARARLQQSVTGVQTSVIASLFSQGAPTDLLRRLIAEAGQSVDLTGVNLEQIAGNLADPLTTAIQLAAERIVSEQGRAPEVAELREAAFDALKQELGNVFSAAERTLMREMGQKYGILDFTMLGDMVLAAREGTMSYSLRALSLPCPAGRTLVDNFADLGKALREFEQAHTQTPQPRGMEHAAACLLDMSMRLTGLSDEQAHRLDAMLHSDLAKGVGHSLLFVESKVAGPKLENLLATRRIMNELRMLSEVRINGQAESDPAYYTANPTVHSIREMPEGVASRIKIVAGGGVVSDLEDALSKHVPPLSEAAWTEMGRLHDMLAPSMSGFPYPHMLPLLLMASADDLMAARADQPLPLPQLWDTLLGGDMPQGVTADNFGARLLSTALTRYRAVVGQAAPELPTAVIDNNFGLGLTQSLPIKKMMELTGPGARLSLTDLHWNMQLSSLTDYTPKNAYGLVTDFCRADPASVMHFETVAESGLEVSPFAIDPQENTATHPLFQQILRVVGGMTQSEAQMARVLQAFSQASLITPRFVSGLFPGAAYSEHGNFRFNAKQQPNGDVVVDIRSDPTLALRFEEQFVIHPDGSHECSQFEMYRPPLGAQ